MIKSIPEKIIITLDDLIRADARVEIINGEVVEMSPSGGTHHIIVSNINRILDRYVFEKGIGSVFPDGLIYLMFSDETGLKDSFVPDVSFISNEKIITAWDIDKPYPGAPDLAVEVISPNESAGDIQTKVNIYLEKGTQQVWVAYPALKELHQFHRDEPLTMRIYKGSRKIETEELFPGIEGLTTDAVFDLPPWAIK